MRWPLPFALALVATPALAHNGEVHGPPKVKGVETAPIKPERPKQEVEPTDRAMVPCMQREFKLFPFVSFSAAYDWSRRESYTGCLTEGWSVKATLKFRF